MLLQRVKQRFASWILIYIIILNELLGFEGFLEKVIQLEWLGTPTKLFPSLLDKLRIDYMNDYSSSWFDTLYNYF